MIAIDTSVVIAAFAPWHEAHSAASRALRLDPRLPAHVLLESYSVMTRFPPPHRAPPDVVEAYLARHFTSKPLTLSSDGYQRLLAEAVALGIIGGQLYDAVIAAEVRRAGAKLLTRDRRASSIYELFGIEFEFAD